jgi:hypothetical protein
MEKDNKGTKMFENLPSFVYITIGWISCIYSIYAFWVGHTYYNWEGIIKPGACLFLEPLCKLCEIGFMSQEYRYMDRTEPWDEFKGKSRYLIYANNLFWYALFFL